MLIRLEYESFNISFYFIYMFYKKKKEKRWVLYYYYFIVLNKLRVYVFEIFYENVVCIFIFDLY